MTKKTIANLDDEMQSHFQSHTENLNIMLNRHEKTLYGPDGNTGICKELTVMDGRMKNVEEMKQEVRGQTVALILLIVAQVVMRVFGI